MATRPRVFTKPDADTFHSPRERIVEYRFPSGRGGLISLRTLDNGTEVVELSQHDAEVQISVKRTAPRRQAVRRSGGRLPDNAPEAAETAGELLGGRPETVAEFFGGKPAV